VTTATDISAEPRDNLPYLLRALANVWDNSCGLPEPVVMDANAYIGIATVNVTDLAAVTAWNRALGGTEEPHTNLYDDRPPIHGVYVRGWHGWIVHITADEQRPSVDTPVSGDYFAEDLKAPDHIRSEVSS
jgi:hypothetical protein